MLATTIRRPPSVADFVPLAEYQSRTPQSFVDSVPVLHLHIPGVAASAPKGQVAGSSLAIFPADAALATSATRENGAGIEELVEQQVDVFVTSDTFILFNPIVAAGVSIPYPSISIHALKQLPSTEQQAVWMQLEFSDGGSSDDDFRLVELTLIPSDPSSSATPTPAAMLYEAMTACCNLHPDRAHGGDDDDNNDGDEYGNHGRIVFPGGAAQHEVLAGFNGVLRGATDGGLPPPMPGSGGWITADNVGEYFDEQGRWIGPGAVADEEEEELGQGAGRTRSREDGVNGHGEDESKRQRVD